MGVWGADVAGLQAVATDLERYADAIDQARTNIEVQLNRTVWQGQNADRFRQRWRTIAIRDLDGFRTDCVQTAAELRRQAHEQLQASSRSGARPGGASAAASLRDSVVPGLASPLLMYPAVARGIADGATTIRDLLFPDPLKSLDTVTGVGLGYLKEAMHPTKNVLLGNFHLKAHLATKGLNGPALKATGYGFGAGVAAITSGFSQWNRDGGTEMATTERATRTATVAGVNTAVSLGVGVGVGAMTAVVPVVGPVLAPWTGKLAAAAATTALETTRVNERIADLGSEMHDVAGQALESIGETASDLVVQTTGGTVDTLRETGKVLQDIGGGVSDAVSGVKSRFNPFSD